jgi:hypothetical protein
MSRARRLGSLALVVLAAAGCRTTAADPGPLASSTVAVDFGTYRLARVGILPFAGRDLGREQADNLQRAFQLELSRVMPYELVPLSHADLAEVRAGNPYLRGRYEPPAILEVARRYRLDGLLIGTVTQHEPYPPQALGLEVELVATETGAPLWTSSVQLDAGDARVRARLDLWQASHKADGGGRESVQLTLVSPERFARFAAWEVASSTLREDEQPAAGSNPRVYSPRNASSLR